MGSVEGEREPRSLKSSVPNTLEPPVGEFRRRRFPVLPRRQTMSQRRKTRTQTASVLVNTERGRITTVAE